LSELDTNEKSPMLEIRSWPGLAVYMGFMFVVVVVVEGGVFGATCFKY
jgi:hypothetical protein